MASRTRYTVTGYQAPTSAPAPTAPVNPNNFYTNPFLQKEREMEQNRLGGVLKAELPFDPSVNPSINYVGPTREQTLALQKLLVQNGYRLAVDGVFGPQTVAAYQDFAGKREAAKQATNTQIQQAYEAKQAQLQRQADEARAKLAALADQVAKERTKQAQLTAQNLRRLTDRRSFDNTNVIAQWRSIDRQQRQSQARAKAEADRKKPKGLKKFALSALDKISLPAAVAFAGFNEAAKKLRPALGLGKLDTGSFSENIKQRKGFGNYIDTGNHALDVAVGITGELIGDPLNLLGEAAIKPFTAVGTRAAEFGVREAAREAGLGLLRSSSTRLSERALGEVAAGAARAEARRGVIEGTRLGEQLLDTAVKAAMEKQTVAGLRKSVKGLEDVAAREALDAGRSGGEAALRERLVEAFAKEQWTPKVRLSRQALAKAGLTGPGLTGGLGKGVLGQGISAGLRKVARGSGEELATATTRRGAQAIAHALDSAAARAGVFVPDVADGLRQRFQGDLVDRMDEVWNIAVKASDAPAFQDAVSEQLGDISRILDNARKGKASVDDAEKIAARLESAAAVLDGDLGDEARRQFIAEMNQGFIPKNTDSGVRVVSDASKNVGLRLPESDAKFGKKAAKDLKAEIDNLGVPQEMKDRLAGDLDNITANNGKGFRRLASTVKALDNDLVREESLRLIDNAAERAARQLPETVGTGGVRGLRQAARGVLSLVESAAPSNVPFQAGATTTRIIAARTEALDRWAMALQLDDVFRQQLTRAGEEVLTEDGLYSIVRDTLYNYGARHGLEGDDLERIKDLFDNGLKKAKKEAKKTQAFSVDASGEVVRNRVSTVAQRIERIPLPDPAEVRNYVDGVIAKKGASAAERAAAIVRLRARGVGEGAIASILKKGHTAWKFSIVTNIHMPVIGAVGGFIGSEGDLKNKLKGAAIGAAIGMVGPVRYVARVPLIEERILRYYMARGFTPKEWIPGVSKWMRRAGVDLPGLSHDAVAGTHVLSRHLSGASRLLTVSEDGWEALGRKQSRFLDSWKRIVNWQIHPESDEVARLLLNEKAGYMTAQQVEQAVKDFIKTDDGKTFLKRFRGSLGNSGAKASDVIDSYRTFINHHLPTMDLAKLRLAAAEDGTEVTADMLKASAKAGLAPDVIHAQKHWIIPRNAKQAIQARNNFFQKFVLAGPTTKMSREPMFEWTYRDEYRRLLRAGNDPKVAQEIADDIAVRKTNEIMFRIDDESRFAQKIDVWAPFQQPREELVRVWAKLALRQPGRTMKVARLAALALNQGEENGIFKRDMYGEYVMSVPGSAALSRALFGVPVSMDAPLKNALFFGQGAYGVGVFPSPGGPWFALASRTWANANPDSYKNMNSVMKTLLFPYGAQGELLRNEPNRLWMAMTGETPPWEFASKADQERELNKWQREVWLQLYSDHVRKTGDTGWEPSVEEVKQATKELFRVWAFTGSVFPSAPHPVMPSREAYNTAREAYTNSVTGKLMYDEFIRDNPQFEPFLLSGSKYTGPDDAKHWLESDEVKADDYLVGFRKQLSLSEFVGEWRQHKAESQAYNEREQIYKEPNRWERERKLIQWRADHPDLAARSKNNYHRDKDLWTILHTYPKSQQDSAIDRWRKEYDVSYSQYKALSEKVRTFRFNAWAEARDTEDVVADVSKQVRLGITEAAYVAMLQPAEQIRYWNYKIGELSFDQGTDDAKKTLDKYYQYRRNLSDLWRNHQYLLRDKTETPYDKMVSQWRGDVSRQISAVYAEINRLKATMDATAKAKDWKNYYALRAKRDALYDTIKAIKNQSFQSFPDLSSLEQDVQAMLVFASEGNAEKLAKIVGDSKGMFISSNEESSFLAMPDEVKQAYVEKLVNSLNTESGKTGKLFWQWLTDFQQEVLESNLPPEMIADWKAETPGQSPNEKKGSGLSGKFFDGHNDIGNGGGELAFALEMFKQYSRRGDRKAPAAYEEYLSLPNNPAVKSQFLKSHPEVGEWISLGPMANMPELYRMIVTNIMVKYGRWEGEPRDINEITDIAFAREQLSRWNKRTGPKPNTYDVWVNMPTGVEKAQFLKDHPEVQDWIRLGPMANMPDEYKDVVRDIMLRYGEWTQRQDDPLGQTIQQYYATPKYARQDFLAQHPELLEYWSLTKSPEEQAMADLSDQYFSLADPNARRMFLSAHPELSQWFVDQRTKRYERFLNKVAQFMGQNPALFESYLQRQGDILAELLQKFAEAPVVREVPKSPTVSTGRSQRGSSEGGRQRRAA